MMQSYKKLDKFIALKFNVLHKSKYKPKGSVFVLLILKDFNIL